MKLDLVTRGGVNKGKAFGYSYRPSVQEIIIENEEGRLDMFTLEELVKILKRVKSEFGENWFPLANNVEKLGNNSEKLGLGRIILEETKKDITHAQASTYLGVIFEDLGIAEWNGKNRGIEWKLLHLDISYERMKSLLERKQRYYKIRINHKRRPIG